MIRAIKLHSKRKIRQVAREIVGLIEDLENGALPWSQVPRFAIWLIGRSFWGWITLLLGSIILLIN